MKGFFRSIFIMAVLAALVVGGFYVYLQQIQPKNDAPKDEVNLPNKIDEARATSAALNADKDGDGLTFAVEKRQGTSDEKVDSDDDGVPDSVDNVPMGSGRKMTKNIIWNYKTSHKIEASLASDVYEYYSNQVRLEHTFDSVYYAQFWSEKDKGLRGLVADLQQTISKMQEKGGWDYYDEIMYIVSSVQQMSYGGGTRANFDLNTQYPMQTVVSGRGDCEDTALLAAVLLKRLEYEVKLVRMDVEGTVAHFGVAVWGQGVEGTSFEEGGKSYYYIETAAPDWKFGEIPTEWAGTSVMLINF